MIKTKFTEMFGIEKPIVQGGMQHLGIAEFASLVAMQAVWEPLTLPVIQV